MELSEYQIRVNAVAPAVVEAPIYGVFIKPEGIHTSLQGFNDFHPIGRVGQPRDIAEIVAFFTLESRRVDHRGNLDCLWRRHGWTEYMRMKDGSIKR